MSVSLIVHGGAFDIPTDLIEAHKSGCKAALVKGWEILEDGGHALDAVEAAVRELEDDPYINAGTGCHLNFDGQIELDASIMEGNGLQAGAVAAVKNIKNPISLARRVLESEHVFLVAEGASLFARETGMEECGGEELLVERELRRWQAWRDNPALHSQHFFGVPKAGTVGAVAMDQRGNIVAGNSTGGSPHKHPGRVGDSPLIGCGVYADNALGGAACTGWGETIIRVAMAKSAVDLLRGGRSVQEAAALSVQVLQEKVGGLGGVIMIDPRGSIGYSFNTPKMAYAYLTDDMERPAVGV